MPAANCCYKGCKNDGRFKNKEYMKGIYFIPFPKPKRKLDQCKRWIASCARPELLTPEKITKNRYVCSFHFLGGDGPTISHPDPVPYHEICTDDTHTTCNLENYVTCNELKKEIAILSDGHSSKECAEDLVSTGIKDENCDHVQSFKINESIQNIKRETYIVADAIFQHNSAYAETENSSEKQEPVNKTNNSATVVTFHSSNTPASSSESISASILSFIVSSTEDLIRKFIEYQFYFKDFQVYWSLSRNIKNFELNIYRLGMNHISIIEIRVLVNLSYDIIIYGRTLCNLQSLLQGRDLQPKICNLNDLLNLFKFIDSFQLCNGCGEDVKNTRFTERSGFSNYFTTALHSVKCELLIKSKKLQRCKTCQKYRKSLLEKIKGSERPGCKFQTHLRNDLIPILKSKNMALHKKVNRLKFTLKKTISKLKIATEKKEDILLGETTDDDSFCKKENLLRLLLKEQLKLLKMNRKNPKKWHPAIIKWCLFLRTKSTSAYETLRETLPLPSRRTLLDYASEFSGKSVFDVKASAEHHYFTVIMDGMEIKEELLDKANTGEVVEICHSNDTGNNFKEAEFPEKHEIH